LSKNIDEVLKNDVKDLISDFSNTAKSSQSIEKVLGDLEQTIEKIDSTIESFNSNGGDMIFNTREKNFGPGELK
jgi:archaellum component FlaC